MKKLMFIFVLASILAVGAFADHPSGWAIGPGFQFGNRWDSSYDAGSSLTLFLKAPQFPIYWGISFDIFKLSDWLDLTVTGDYFLIDKRLIPDVNFGWFLGVGGYVNLLLDSDFTMFDFGGRLPIGLYIMPLDFLEIFLDIAPSVGFYYQNIKNSDAKTGLGGGWRGDFGVRFWF